MQCLKALEFFGQRIVLRLQAKPVSFLRVFVFSPTSTQDAGAGSTPARSSTAHPTIEEIQRLTHLASV